MYAWLIGWKESTFRSSIREAPEKSPFWGSFALKMKIPGAETFGLPIISSFRYYVLKYNFSTMILPRNSSIVQIWTHPNLDSESKLLKIGMVI